MAEFGKSKDSFYSLQHMSVSGLIRDGYPWDFSGSDDGYDSSDPRY